MKRIIFSLLAISLCVVMMTSCCCCDDSSTSTSSDDTTDIGNAFQKGFKYGWNCESGRQAFDKGEYDKAIGLYKEAIELDSEDKDAYIGIANVYIAQAKYDEAITNLKKAQEIDPKDDNITALLEKAKGLADSE